MNIEWKVVIGKKAISLSRVCMNWNGGLGSWNDDLADSNGIGRVVVVNAEGRVAPNFSATDYNSQIKKIYQEKITKAKKIKTNALEALAKL